MASAANPKNTVILPFQQAIKQHIGPASRIVGLVRLKHFFDLIEFENLQANPRESKKSDITLEIQESLEDESDIFPLLSKGVLIASTNAVELDRDHRYKLSFENREIEGILDGGHNTLAIGRFILSKVLETPSEKRELREAKDFQSYKKLYKKHWQAQQDFLKDPANTSIAEILIPVELLIPQSTSDFVISDFIEVIPMVQEARNKNAQLTSKTWANHEGLFEELPVEQWEEMFNTNVHGLFYCSRVVIPSMKETEESHIINIASIAGSVGIEGMAGYCGTKWAVRGISQSMYKELRKFGIKVSVISPGSVNTHFFDNVQSMQANENMMRPEDIAESILYLLETSANYHPIELEVRPLRPKGK
jgi:hypothetical protein